LILRMLSLIAACALSLSGPKAMDYETPHITLHTDINKTIVVEDIAKGLNVEGCLNSLLSDAPEYAYTWSPDGPALTFRQWVNQRVCTGSDVNTGTKLMREKLYRSFMEQARHHNHPQLEAIEADYAALNQSIEGQHPRRVLTSFSNLIKHLEDRKHSFSVVLRTFGHDLQWVSEELGQDGLDSFIQGSFSNGALTLGGTTHSTPADIAAVFRPAHHYAIQDNYHWWREHGLKADGGKPFPIALNDRKVLSLFFDDNASDQEKPILNIQSIGPNEATLDMLLDLHRVVAVDTRTAILNPNYFIEIVERALDKHRLST
jgi:hypothetical protein